MSTITPEQQDAINPENKGIWVARRSEEGPDMRDEPKNWRESKAPKWVLEAAAAEIKQWQLTAVLSWPTEARPAPMPFHWGEYDKLFGEPVEGTYWLKQYNTVSRVEIKRGDPNSKEWGMRGWLFNKSGRGWSPSVERGDLYATRREAILAIIWEKCDHFASELLALRGKL